MLELKLPNGTLIQGFGADEPKRLRGPQFHFMWAEELAQWKARKVEGNQVEHPWDMAKLCLRLGKDPRGVITTTPKPLAIIRDLIRAAMAPNPSVVVSRASTYANRENLAAGFFSDIIKKYEGTRLGRQELEAEFLEAMEGALWSLELLDELRIENPDDVDPLTLCPELKRVIVAIDPAATSEDESNETGIVGAGAGVDDQLYVLADESGKYKPVEWARTAIALAKRLKADAIVAEINNGGEMVEHTIRMVDPNIKVICVHATRGKAVRAEPVSAIYEQKRAHHIGTFKELEEQQCNFNANGEYGLHGSPDRMDALVWAATELLVLGISFAGVVEFYRQQSVALREAKAFPPGVALPPKTTDAPGVVYTAPIAALPAPLGRDSAYIRNTLMRGGR
jgi:phage terminase large subunit-like protein